MAKRVGRKSKAQTPAPPKERIFGSKKNPKGSASSEKSASKIRLNKEIIKGLENKLAKFKEENPNKKNVNLNDLKAVFRRGLGAYSSSHRPTITGGVPNTRNAWAFARVNKFLKKASGEKVKKAYVQDDDLLKMEKGGELNDINIPKSDYLRNIRAKVLSIYSENDAVEFRADFGDNGGITWEIPAHQVEKGLVNNPTYLIVQSMDRDKDNLSLVATKEGSKGEGAKTIASLFNIYPSLEEIGYDDYSQFDSGGSFWQKIGGSEDILTRENFFEYYKTKGYAKGGEVDRGQANYGEPNVTIDKIPLIHETINKYANSILKEGFKKSSNKNITLGVYTIPLVWKKSPFDNSSRSGTEIKVKLKKGSKIFWTNTNRPMDFYYGVGNKYFNSLFKKLGGKNDDSTRLKFLRNFEKWLDDNGYCGVQQGGEIVITNLSCIDKVEKYTRDKLAKGGEVDKKVLRERWAKKKDALENLANNISRLRKNLSKDLKEGNEKEKLTALVVKIMDETGERVGNEESANNGHFGVTGLKKNHIKINGSRVKFKYVGKSGVEHEKELNDYTIASALKQAMSQSPSEYVFETSEGFRIKNDRVNRYLNIFNVSAKDLRGYSANKWIINKLKSVKDKEILNNDAKRKKKFNEIVKSVAEKVGHGSATLKKHYLLPSLEREFVNHGKIVDLSNIKRTYKHGGQTDEVNTGVDVIHNIDADPLDELKDIPNDGEGVFARGGNIENRVKGEITIYSNGSAFVTLKSNYGYKNEVGYADIYYVTIKKYFNKPEQKKIIDALTKKGVNPNSKIRVIEFLEIYENYRGKGYASYLVKEIIEYYKEAGDKYLVLGVGQGSDAPEEGHGKKALSHKALFDFYSRHGFESILEGENYMIIDLEKVKFDKGGKTQIKEANKELVEKTDTSLLLPTYTIEDVKTYVDDLNREDINDILDKLNMPFNVVDELGSGANGIAWQTNRGTVLKITKSGQEAYSSYIIFKNQENFSSQAEIYNLFVVIDLEDLEKYYFIEKQLLRPARDVMSDELLDLYRDIEMIATSNDSKQEKIDEFYQLINDEDINLDDIDKEYAEQIFELAMKVKEEAKPYGLNLNDNHSGNVGFDWMGKLYCFDCGYVEKKSFLIGGNLNNKLMLKFKDGGEITQEDKKEIYAKWRKLVNMSRSELERFYNSEEGKVAGLTPQEAEEAGIDSGRESARWIMKMKSTKVADWTPMMWKWAKKQISFISRMSGNKGKLVDENGAKTRKHLSLLIWGHNPNKKGMGGDVEEPCHVCSMSEGGYNQLPSLTEMADGKRFIYREDVFRKGGDTNTHVGSRYMILECMGEGGITDTLNLKVIQSSDGLLPNTMITRPIRNIINRGREMGERFGKTIVGSYKKGGELNPDDKKVKNYFEHKSGEAGGLLVGKRHSEGGIKAINHSTGQPLEMEGGEVVITRDAVSDSTKREFEGKYMTNREILSAINVSGGGVAFAEGGETPDRNC